MPTINENIAELQQKTTDLITAHTDIKNAIIAKGGTVNDGDKFSDYPEDIATIKNELTSISINENGTYKNGTLDTVTGAEYPIEIVANGEPIVSMTVDGNTVQDGTPAPTAPVDAIGVGIKSENLFDATGVAKGRINSSTGAMEYAEDTPTLTYSDTNNEFTITTRYAWRGFVTEYLDLQEKPVFSYISDDGTFYAFSYAYDINKNYLGAITSTAPTGTKYIRVSIQCSTILTNAKIKNIMLNEGRERLPYEPYGYYLPTSINGGNDINAYFGNYQTTRKIKKLVLTGEETCSATKISNNLYCFSFKYSDVGMTDILDYDVDMRTIPYPQFISSHFKMKAAPTVFPDEYGNINDGEIGANSVRTQDVPSSQVTYNRYFILCAAGYTSTTEFKNWLTAQYQAGTPVTIWYILATPQTTTSSEPLMKIGDYADQLTLTDSDITLPTVTGNNLVDYDLTVKPSSASISYYKLGVNKTITSDTLPIEFESTGDNAALLLQGNTTQNDTPTPDNPIQPQGCGDMSSNLWSYHPDTTSGGVRLLWDGEKINYSNTCTYASNSTMTINLKKGTYTLKVNANRIPVENDYSCIDIYHPSSGLLKQVTNRNAVNGKVTFTIDDDLSNASLRIRLDNGTNYDGFEIRPMLNIGETSLPYDVYGQYKIPISSGSTTTPIYLGEVQSTRQIKKLVLDGTEHWVYRQGEPSNVFFLETIDVNVVDNHGLCTHYLNQDSGGFDVLQDKHVLIKLSSTGTKWFLGVRDSDFGLPDFKAYLAAQYTAGTPVTIWYVLATEETGIVNEPLMRIGDYADTLSSVQAQVQIPTTVGHNTFNVNTTVKPSSTSITYNDLNTIGYNEINVDVPNTYTVEDEGKVVNNATLVAQTAMPTEITANDTYDTTLYNSIVVNVPAGGSTGTKNDVTFYDYDGTIVTSYSKDEFANLTALPANPTHEGLTSQGWNWSLADAKAYVADNNKLDIGQMYVTSDGKTRLYITLTEGRISPILQLYLNDNSELDIDWGDGSTHSTFTSTSADYVNERHNYATAGDYVIAITVTTGSFVLQSSSTNVSSILWNGNNIANSPDRAYNNSIKKIEIGSGITTINYYAFSNCYSLTSITIPDGVTSIGDSAFTNCRSLTSITIPDEVTSIGTQAFQYCYSLSSITIPDTVTSISNYTFYSCSSLSSITIPTVRRIGDYAFQSCYSLKSITIPDTVTGIGIYVFSGLNTLSSINIPDSVTTISNFAFAYDNSITSITIPDGVTSIGNSAFSACYSLTSVTIPDKVTSISAQAFANCTYMESIKFKRTTPPSVANSNVWYALPASCTILVPINTFSAYTTATNYPSSSTYTYLVFGTYESGATLPTTSTDNYILTWYASIADAIAQTNPITTGNGNEVYARCIVDTSVTRTIDFDNNTSTLSGDPSTHPIYTNIKRCTVQDNGTITSYYGDSNYVEDGSIGQVMVYIPKFYYKVNVINKQLIDDTHPEYGYDIHEASYSVSNIKYPGYKLHPAFINANGDEVDYVLCSAFEGSTYDTSASAYNTNDAQTVDFTASTGDLLASIGYVDSSGTTVHVKPASGLTQNLTRPNSMTIAKNRGAGWYALTFKPTSAIQMLITIEYGCNSQVNIADGVVGITDNTSYNCASYVGSTVGNTTGHAASTINEINGTETTYTSATTTSVNWRGIENMWGNIWKWVDGINIYGDGSQRGGVPYVCTDMNFSDTNTDNYESVGFTIANTDGYVKYFGWGNDKYDWVFMPSTAGSGGASVSTTVGDYFYKTANLNGYKAARLGGSWTSSSNAGVFCWNLNNAASARYRILGARLMYVPM